MPAFVLRISPAIKSSERERNSLKCDCASTELEELQVLSHESFCLGSDDLRCHFSDCGCQRDL